MHHRWYPAYYKADRDAICKNYRHVTVSKLHDVNVVLI